MPWHTFTLKMISAISFVRFSIYQMHSVPNSLLEDKSCYISAISDWLTHVHTGHAESIHPQCKSI